MMRCHNVDRVKPLDELLDENISEFNSGYDRECNKDLDALIWGLGDFENETPHHEAKEYDDEPPSEEELVETGMVAGKGRRSSVRRGGQADEVFSTSVNLVSARSLSPDTIKKRKKR